MELLHFNAERCNLCRRCVRECPFQALHIREDSIEVDAGCKMCGLCIKNCKQNAIYFEQKTGTVDKSAWNDILVYAEQEEGAVHPVVFELIGEAHKLAAKQDYKVKVVMAGPKGTAANAEHLKKYGVDTIYIYEHNGFEGFKADCHTDAIADCIASIKPSVVLVGATPLGRSLAPRLATRFHTGLTADCTKLEMRDNSDLVQIRPAFGGNIMAQILITDSRPQFATVRYKVMDRASQTDAVETQIVRCEVPEKMPGSGIELLDKETIPVKDAIEDAEILIVAGRGIRDEKGLELVQELAAVLGGKLCYTRPMVEAGYGDTAHQIGLSGRTVKPSLIITCGVSGAIQFTACMNQADCIVAIDSNPDALIFNTAHYCIKDDLYEVVPQLITRIKKGRTYAGYL